MGRSQRTRSREQRELRRRRGERAFLFDKEVSHCLGSVNREEWEFAVPLCRGDVAAAARQCGLAHVPAGAKALWGRSAEDALGSYRRWQKHKKQKRGSI